MMKQKMAADEATPTVKEEKHHTYGTTFLPRSQVHVILGRVHVLNGVRYVECLVPEELVK